MKFLYATKGCSHCDSRVDCPKELKNSDVNLLKSSREVGDRNQKWTTFCADFIRFTLGGRK